MNGAAMTPFRRRGFALLWTGGLISLTGDWMLRVAVPIYVYRLTRSPAATSAVVAVMVAVSVLVGPLAGILVDRWDRRRIMIAANATQAVTLLPLLLVHRAADLPLLFAVLAVQTTLAQLVDPAEPARVEVPVAASAGPTTGSGSFPGEPAPLGLRGRLPLVAPPGEDLGRSHAAPSGRQ